MDINLEIRNRETISKIHNARLEPLLTDDEEIEEKTVCPDCESLECEC